MVVCHSQGTIIMGNVLEWLYRAIARNERPAEPMGRAARRAAGAPAPPELVYPDAVPLDLAEFSLLTREHLQKLEVYAFATCAQEFRHPEHRDWPRPWIEHFGNEHDIVARLGMLAPRPRLWRIRVDGARYEHPGAWGHLLNAHYLTPIGASQKHGHRRGGCGSMEPFRPAGSDARRGSAAPRLFAYINGGRPAA